MARLLEATQLDLDDVLDMCDDLPRVDGPEDDDPIDFETLWSDFIW